VAFVLPKATVSADSKFEPVIVTCVPAGPDVGETLTIVGAPVEDEVYVNPPERVAVKLPGSSTDTFTGPAAFAGVTAWISVVLTIVTLEAVAVPNSTDAPARKFVPLIVTAVPPDVGPLFGDTLLTDGVRALYVKFTLDVLDSPFTWMMTPTVPAMWLGVTV
jgi:hypothetical protein